MSGRSIPTGVLVLSLGAAPVALGEPAGTPADRAEGRKAPFDAEGRLKDYAGGTMSAWGKSQRALLLDADHQRKPAYQRSLEALYETLGRTRLLAAPDSR